MNPLDIIINLMKFNIIERSKCVIERLEKNTEPHIVKKEMIHNEKKDTNILIDKLNEITHIDEISEDMIFSKILNKGIKRIKVLYYFIQGYIYVYDNRCIKLRWWNKCNELQINMLIGLFIIENQIWGDGNHRTAMYYMKRYGDIKSDKLMESIEFIRGFQLPHEINHSNDDIERWITHIISYIDIIKYNKLKI